MSDLSSDFAAPAGHPTDPAGPNAELRRLVLHIAQNVTAARAAAGLTQRELAAEAELSRATVHLIEAGACDPRVSTIAHLARALRLTPVQLLKPHAEAACPPDHLPR